MTVRCSLLGCDWEEDTERDTTGEHDVQVTRVFDECRNCGQRRNVSERKHVSLSEAEAGATSAPAPAPATNSDGSNSLFRTSVVKTDGGASDDDSDHEATDEATPVAEYEAEQLGDDEIHIKGGGDAVIIDATEENHRDFGDGVPEGSETESDDSAQGQGTDSTGSPSEILDGGSPIDHSPTPESEAEEDESAAILDGEGSGAPLAPNTAGILFCSDCGYQHRLSKSPLREGDICPDCRREFLALSGE
jgi:hypothetical protein